MLGLKAVMHMVSPSKQLDRASVDDVESYLGKALRTVKSCVGTNWCRYGIGDSVGSTLVAYRLQQCLVIA